MLNESPPLQQPPKKRQKTLKHLTHSQLSQLLSFDRQILTTRSTGCTLIGLDEVGRGSLIDSVVGGAVCLPETLNAEQERLLTALNDSKQLTPRVRAELSKAIHEFCITGIGEASREEIEQLNIHYASLLAVHRAFEQLSQKAGLNIKTDDYFLLMDGRAIIPDYPAHRQQAIVKGDGLSASIAAASVIAKHYRDSKVQTLAQAYPQYGWDVNMGYPTPSHLKALAAFGASPYHRQSFKSVREQLKLELNLKPVPTEAVL